MPDWPTLEIANPALLLLAPAMALLLLIAAWTAGRRHGWAVAITSLAIRAFAAMLLVVGLAGLTEVVEQTSRFEPSGTWRLLLDDGAPSADAQDFHESASEFVSRVRDALLSEAPPARAEVWGPREEASRARDSVLALGLPATAHWPLPEAEAVPRIHTIKAPRVLQPGEVARVHVSAESAGAELTLLLDGQPLVHVNGSAQFHVDGPRRHVLECVLLDAQGRELQRAGHVLRVGDYPRLLLLGLSEDQVAQVEPMTPGWQVTHETQHGLSGAELEDADVVLTSVDALYRLPAPQAHELSLWVARGGGLYVTGDGAKHVEPDYFAREALALLPVILRREGRPPEPEDPPVEEIPGKAEIAKVSVIFVLDRSGSMDWGATRRPGAPARWQVAVTGVTRSLDYIAGGEGRRDESFNTRVGVMAFTLRQNWVLRPRSGMLAFNRAQLRSQLENLTADREYDPTGYNTDIYAAMQDAISVMEQEPSAVRVIVLLSDGADRPANIAAGLRHRDLRERAIAGGINIVTVGIGDEFDPSHPAAGAARAVVEDLATRREYIHIPGSGPEAEQAHVIFVDTVEAAFTAYDEMKREEENERRRRQEEAAQQPETGTVDVMAGEFPLRLTEVGTAIFGDDLLPRPAPRAGWYARTEAKADAAVALELDAEDSPPALAFRAHGLGRVAIWTVGTDPQALGEVAGWGEFPGLFAAGLRWLLPREVPDLRLVAEATPHAITLVDPLPEARYQLRGPNTLISLFLTEDRLTATHALPEGPAEVWEGVGEQWRLIGDVFVAAPGAGAGAIELLDDNRPQTSLPSAPPRSAITRREWPTAALLLGLAFLVLMPMERAVRRRA